MKKKLNYFITGGTGSFSKQFIKNLIKINVHSKNDLNNAVFKDENISISVKKKQCVTELLKLIYKMLKKIEPRESVFLTNKRQINITKEIQTQELMKCKVLT